jgi:hypothetical protein
MIKQWLAGHFDEDRLLPLAGPDGIVQPAGSLGGFVAPFIRDLPGRRKDVG